MFSKRVSFQDGSYVEWVNVEAIRYVEASGRTLDIPWVFTNNFKRGRTLKLDSLRSWDTPHRDDSLSSAQLAEIIGKVKEYCRRRGIPLTLE